MAMAQLADDGDDDELPIVKPTRYAGTVDLTGDVGGDVDGDVDGDVVSSPEITDAQPLRDDRQVEVTLCPRSGGDDVFEDCDADDDEDDDDIDDDYTSVSVASPEWAVSPADRPIGDVSCEDLIGEMSRRECWCEVPTSILLRELNARTGWSCLLQTDGQEFFRKRMVFQYKRMKRKYRKEVAAKRNEVAERVVKRRIEGERLLTEKEKLLEEMTSAMALSMEGIVDAARKCVSDVITAVVDGNRV